MILKFSKTKMMMVLTFLMGSMACFAMDVGLQPQTKPPSECVLPDRKLDDQTLPSGYQHCPIAKQIEYYRTKVYDVALAKYQGNVKALKSKPIPGLFLVLENAFALVNDATLLNIEQKAEHLGEDRQRWVDKLKKYWDEVKVLNEVNGGLTTRQFIAYNEFLAFYVDCFKEINFGKLDEPIKTYEIFKSEDIDANITFIIFIIYGNPKPGVVRNISPFHFVDQFFKDDYSGYIAFFDILSSVKVKQEERGTNVKGGRSKRDPHWSLENGTFKMLWHDMQHIDNQASNITPWSKARLKKIYDLQKEYEKDKNDGEKMNKALILRNGLFLMTHESPASVKDAESDNRSDLIYSIIRRLQTSTGSIRNYGSESYKEEDRDWEATLKSTYADPKDPKKFIAIHDEKGPFLPSPTYFLKDKKLKAMPREGADAKARQDAMKLALEDGFKRFWDYYLKLVEKL